MTEQKPDGTTPATTPTTPVGPPSSLCITAPPEGSGVGKKFSVMVQLLPAVAGCEITGYVLLGSTRYPPTPTPSPTTDHSGSCSLSFELPLTARGTFSLKVYTVNALEPASYIGHYTIDALETILEILDETLGEWRKKSQPGKP